MYLGLASSALLSIATIANCGTVGCDNIAREVAKESAEIVIEQRKAAANQKITDENPTVENEEPIEEFDPLYLAKLSSKPDSMMLNVPFTPQAPHANWSAPYDEACEEASLIMVEYFLNEKELSQNVAKGEINYLVNIEDRMGYAIDISTSQIATIARQTYKRKSKRYTGSDVSISNIKNLIADGYPIILPVAGRELDNPNFVGEGPPYHVIVLTGYDNQNFYSHDPGTQYGNNYAYPQDVINNAIHEWTGSKSTVEEGERAMLVLEDERLRKDYVAAYSF